MSCTERKKALRLCLILALTSLTAAVVYGIHNRNPAVQSGAKIGAAAPSGAPVAGKSRPPATRDRRPRRDGDYWPQTPHPIALRHRTLLPTTEFPANSGPKPDQGGVWLVQFGGPLAPENIAALQQENVTVFWPTTAGAFHVRATQAALAGIAKDRVPRVLGWCRLQPEDKLLPGIFPEPPAWPAYALLPDGSLCRQLSLYPGTDAEAIAAEVRALGGSVHAVTQGILAGPSGRIAATLDVSGPRVQEFSVALAALEDVYAVGLPPPPKRVCNTEAAACSNINLVQATPYSYSGTGVVVMVRDEGAVFGHPDLAGRLTLGPDVASQPSVQHSTHVAGTIAGSGAANPVLGAKGMAPACTIVSYDLLGDDVAEPLQARATYGALLSNHSYGFATGWDNGTFYNNQNTFGVYGTFARNWDQLVATYGLILVKAAGNSRDGGGAGQPHNGVLAPDGEYYNTTDSSATGKNILVVGAALDSAYAAAPSGGTALLASSSSGPCVDGRLRPEIVANGDTLMSCNNSSVPGSEYVSLSGASMACAVVTGATTLFLEGHERHYGATAVCPPHLVRAVFAQTAADFGRPGPDYLHGYGLLDLLSAVRVLEADVPLGSRIANSTVDAATAQRFFAIAADGIADIKATLCWTDAPGDILALNAIVNNLDLYVMRVSDQAIFLPFNLDPAHPEQPAVRAANNVDTIEQAVVAAPPAGQYLLVVRGTALATPANFTLVSSQPMAENIAPVPVIHASQTSGAPPLLVSFDGSGSSDADGSIARWLWDFGDGTAAEGPAVQHTYAAGIFSATLKVIDNQGAFASTSIVIAAGNTSPIAALSVSPNSGLPPLLCLMNAAGSFDPDGAIVSYAWDFGDGTSAQGEQVSHTYVAPGLYFVALTVTDNGNAAATATAGVFVGENLDPYTSRFKLNFRKVGSDTFSLSSRNAPVDPSLVTTAAMTGSVQVGNVTYQFTLDSKGNYKAAPLKVKLVPAKRQIVISLTHAYLQTALASSSATSRDTKHEIIRVPVAVILNGGTIAGSPGLPYDYTARQGKTGAGKLIVLK